MTLDHMADFVCDHRSQLGLAFRGHKQAAVDADVAPRQRKGIDLRVAHAEHGDRLRRPARRMGRQATSHRSEEHTSELQSLMRISYAVFCLKKKKTHYQN